MLLQEYRRVAHRITKPIIQIEVETLHKKGPEMVNSHLIGLLTGIKIPLTQRKTAR